MGLLWRAGCVMGALQLRNARAMTAGSRLPARGARGTPARHGSGRMHMWLFARAPCGTRGATPCGLAGAAGREGPVACGTGGGRARVPRCEVGRARCTLRPCALDLGHLGGWAQPGCWRARAPRAVALTRHCPGVPLPRRASTRWHATRLAQVHPGAPGCAPSGERPRGIAIYPVQPWARRGCGHQLTWASCAAQKCSLPTSRRPPSSGCGAWSTCTTSSAPSTSASGSKRILARGYCVRGRLPFWARWSCPRANFWGAKLITSQQRLRSPKLFYHV